MVHHAPGPKRRLADRHDSQSIRPAISFPCCVAPAAMQKMAHPDGEEATARAAGSKGVLMGLSSFATTSLEVVKSECDKASRSRTSECVLQMYLFENREVSDNLIRRSESTFSLRGPES